MPGLILSLCLVHFLSRKLAFAIPMGLIPVPLIPIMAAKSGLGSGGTIGTMFLARLFIYSAFNLLWTMVRRPWLCCAILDGNSA